MIKIALLYVLAVESISASSSKSSALATMDPAQKGLWCSQIRFVAIRESAGRARWPERGNRGVLLEAAEGAHND